MIRGGYGVFYDPFFTNISDNTASASPNALGVNITRRPGRGQADPLGTVAAFTAAVNPLTTQTSVNDGLRNPLTQQWNLNVQRELPARIKMEVAYVGTRGERLWFNQQLNPRVLGGTVLSRPVARSCSAATRVTRSTMACKPRLHAPLDTSRSGAAIPGPERSTTAQKYA